MHPKRFCCLMKALTDLNARMSCLPLMAEGGTCCSCCPMELAGGTTNWAAKNFFKHLPGSGQRWGECGQVSSVAHTEGTSQHMEVEGLSAITCPPRSFCRRAEDLAENPFISTPVC